MAKDNLDKALEYIEARNWSVLRPSWLNYLPVIHPAGAPLLDDFTSLPGIEEIASGLLDPQGPAWKVIDMAGLRPRLLHEGVYYLHKSSHVIGLAQSGAFAGTSTWSLSDAYHGALFGAKAILSLLGVTVIEIKNRSFLLDVWTPSGTQSKKKRRPSTEDLVPVVIRTGLHRAEQRDVWRIFQRTVRVSKVEAWPNPWATQLRLMDIASFAKQRNFLLYKANAWVFEDLHYPSCVLGYGDLGPAWREVKLESYRKDFTMALAVQILVLGMLLFKTLAEHSNRLTSEWDLLKNGLSTARHPILTRNETLMRYVLDGSESKSK